MLKLSKRMLSIFLAIMLFALSFVQAGAVVSAEDAENAAQAAETVGMTENGENTEKTEYEQNEEVVNAAPRVDLRGAFHTLYYDAGTPEQRPAMSLDGGGAGVLEVLLEELKGDIKTLVLDATLGRWDDFSDKLTHYTDMLLGVTAYDKNGEPVNEMNGDLNDNRWQLEEMFWWDIYSYDFDWRDDPMRQADVLHEFIQKVKAKHGVEKVILTAQSGSGHLGMAYLSKYGTKDLCGFNLRASLHNGSSLFGDLVNKRVSINDDAIADMTLYDDLGISQEIQDKLIPIFKILRDSELLRLVAALGNRGVRKVIDKFYEDAVIPILLSQPVYWAYVPVADYEDGIKEIFGKDARTGEWAGLIKKLDTYHYGVKVRVNDILKDTGTKMRTSIMANYGGTLAPLVENAHVQADVLVDCVYASSGATVAAPTKTLKGPFFGLKPYVQKVDCGHNHISPDNVIDASTCALPETTWFFSGGDHFKIDEYGFNTWFFDAPEPQTVFTEERYPQYLMADEERLPIPMVVEEVERSFGDIMLQILVKLAGVIVFVFTWWFPPLTRII